MSSDVVLVDDPAPQVRRVTLNRPEKRNALNHALRGGILQALREADQDPEIRVMIVRGAGKCFSSGYDLGGGNEGQEYPWYTPGGDGHWPRHVTQGWMSIWELAKPVIAQVHGSGRRPAWPRRRTADPRDAVTLPTRCSESSPVCADACQAARAAPARRVHAC